MTPTPQGMERTVAEFRALVSEANLLRDSILGLLDQLRAVHDDIRRLYNKADDDKPVKRPALELVKTDPVTPGSSQSTGNPC